MRTSNYITITGNLGANVEFQEHTPGKEVAQLRVAETVSRADPKTGVFEPVHTNWIPVTAFGTLAKRAMRSLKKGDRITVQGALKTTSYEKDGAKRRAFEVIASSIERAQFLESSKDGNHSLTENIPSFEEFTAEKIGGQNE